MSILSSLQDGHSLGLLCNLPPLKMSAETLGYVSQCTWYIFFQVTKYVYLQKNVYIFPDGIFPKIPNHSENSTMLYKFNCLVLENPHPLKISISSLGGVGIFYGTAHYEEWEGTRNDNMISISGLGGVILKFRKRVLPASFTLLINN